MLKRTVLALTALVCVLALSGCSALTAATNSQTVILTDDFTTAPELAAENSTASKSGGTAKSTGSKSRGGTKNKSSSQALKTQNPFGKAKTYTPKKVAQNLLLSGRATLVTGGAALDWDCAAVTFKANCSGEILVTLSAQGGGIAYLRAFVNGKEISAGRIALTAENAKQVTLASNLPAGTHTVQLLRISGSEPPYITLTGITLNGSFLPPPTLPEDRIVFVGGTPFTGEAALLSNEAARAAGEDETPLRRVENRDSSKTFAYLTAKRLGLSYEIITRANTAFGISDFHKDTVHLTQLYGLSTRREGGQSYQVSGRVKYVVISGVNADFNLSLHKAEGKSAAKSFQKQQDFIRTMQEQYPGCKIIWCYGQRPLSSYYLSCIQQSVQLRGGQAGGVYLLKLSACERLERPGAETHQKLAQELYSFIQKLK